MPNPLETAASKAMGLTKEAKAQMLGLRGVFATLAKEHGEVTALLKRVQLSEDTDVRRNLFPKIRAELLSHEQAELKEVYPTLRQHPATSQIAEEHDLDAKELSDMIRTIETLNYESPEWMDAFDSLAKIVEEHAELEENEYFPVAMEAIGADEARRLDAGFTTTKQKLLQHLEATQA
jgi:hemerythrin superfamily protein